MTGVESDALLATIVGSKLHTHVPDERPRVSKVARFTPFQFDDLGAHVPKDHSSSWSGLPTGQF